MNMVQACELVGQVRSVRVNDITVPCRILDVKMSYGKYRFLIEPVEGKGSEWIESSRIQ